jgi:hypothetical protein
MALEWLKLNHKDYYDLEISYENLMQYPEEGSPVVVTYKSAFENKLPEATSLHDNEEEEGVEDGDCYEHGLSTAKDALNYGPTRTHRSHGRM